MMNIGLQFFAHKKGMGSTKNGRDSTLVAKADGVLRFEKLGKDRKQACVYPAE